MKTLLSQMNLRTRLLLNDMESRKCPKCGGTLSLDFDDKAGYMRGCLNCGYVDYVSSSNPKPVLTSSRKLRPEGWHILQPAVSGRSKL